MLYKAKRCKMWGQKLKEWNCPTIVYYESFLKSAVSGFCEIFLKFPGNNIIGCGISALMEAITIAVEYGMYHDINCNVNINQWLCL